MTQLPQSLVSIMTNNAGQTSADIPFISGKEEGKSDYVPPLDEKSKSDLDENKEKNRPN
jgi:hypothetical protein